MRKITIKEIYSRSSKPCKEDFAKLLQTVTKNEDFNNTGLKIAKQYLMLSEEQKDIEVSLLDILNSNGVEDAYCALRCWDYKDYCLLLANVAESVLPYFEEKYGYAKDARKAIEAIRKYKRGEIDKEQLEDASYRAHYDSHHYSVAAAVAASCIDGSPGAFTASYASVANAASGISAVTTLTDNDVSITTQWEVNEKLMRDFIKNN